MKEIHSKKELASYIDHTILKADATKADIDSLCEEALKYNFASVCINPSNLEYAKTKLENTDIKLCTVIGFPLGASSKKIKIAETEQAIKDGATEIDMVANIGWIKDGKYSNILDEINEVKGVMPNDMILKVIIETAILSNDEKVQMTKVVADSEAEFIKTSTGMNKSGGATIEDVKILNSHSHTGLLVKASGGIRNLETLQAMLTAGASRIGASAGVSIVNEWES